ncbi:MAG: dioxygenase [Acidimicrobiia bacterium]
MAISRRRVLQVAGGVTAVLAGGGIGLAWLQRWASPGTLLTYRFPETSGTSGLLLPTPACRDGDSTESQIEGPFYKPNTPLRTVLREPDTVGIPLVIEGRVLSTDCRPIVGAVLDVWSCDGNGVYDNGGFKLRGHQFTNSQGAFRIETVKPKDYQQLFVHRTPHIHVKVQGRETSLLTTQLYFPGEPLNGQDSIFSETLLMKVERAGDGVLHASFDFVLRPRPQA